MTGKFEFERDDVVFMLYIRVINCLIYFIEPITGPEVKHVKSLNQALS